MSWYIVSVLVLLGATGGVMAFRRGLANRGAMPQLNAPTQMAIYQLPPLMSTQEERQHLLREASRSLMTRYRTHTSIRYPAALDQELAALWSWLVQTGTPRVDEADVAAFLRGCDDPILHLLWSGVLPDSDDRSRFVGTEIRELLLPVQLVQRLAKVEAFWQEREAKSRSQPLRAGVMWVEGLAHLTIWAKTRSPQVQRLYAAFLARMMVELVVMDELHSIPHRPFALVVKGLIDSLGVIGTPLHGALIKRALPSPMLRFGGIKAPGPVMVKAARRSINRLVPLAEDDIKVERVWALIEKSIEEADPASGVLQGALSLVSVSEEGQLSLSTADERGGLALVEKEGE